MNPLKPRERIKIPRQGMPQRSPQVRVADFQEVNLGLETELARTEALRCLECAHPACVERCPVGVQVKAFVDLVLQGDYLSAAAKVREDNALPGITGRVCPQETQCEGACILGRRFAPLAIGHLERFVADFEARVGKVSFPQPAPRSGKRVAIIGSGPAGLTAAADLALSGHSVTVFEALHELGGVLVYGIPEFRLPKEIVREEIDKLRGLGIEFQINTVIGKTLTLDELFEEEGYDAVFVATGAGSPHFLEIPGEDLIGVYSANEFLTRVNLMRAHEFPRNDQPVHDCRGKSVAVFGGGNTAMDAIRSALRLGAARARLIYRRGEEDMPARAEEIQHAKEEGVEVVELTQPIEFLGDQSGWLTAVRCVRMEPGPTDESGRRRPLPVANSEFVEPLDLAIIAIGTTANPLIQSSTPDLKTRKGGYIEVDPETLQTSRAGVFAGGDIVTGSATVILAMAAGRRAARHIDRYLTEPREGAGLLTP